MPCRVPASSEQGTSVYPTVQEPLIPSINLLVFFKTPSLLRWGDPPTMFSALHTVIRRDAPGAVQGLVGPFYLGMVINYLLWGVMITQSYYYYKNYRKTDRKWLKAGVALLFVIDLIETITLSQTSWVFLVQGWGDLPTVTTFPGWGFYATPLADTFIASIVHFFYAQKIYTLLDSPSNMIGAGLVVALSCTQLTGGFGGTIYLFVNKTTLAEFPRFKTWACVWLVTAAVTDIVITALMTWKLSKSRTGFKRTDDIISKIIRLTVETGLATAVVQIADIIVYLVWPLQSYHIVLAFMAPKVYSNSMLALLNSRQPRSPTNTTSQAWDSSQGRPVESIQIHTSRTVNVDDYEMDTKPKSREPAFRAHAEQRVPADGESYLPFTSKGT